jgi:hypothetical protein
MKQSLRTTAWSNELQELHAAMGEDSGASLDSCVA